MPELVTFAMPTYPTRSATSHSAEKSLVKGSKETLISPDLIAGRYSAAAKVATTAQEKLFIDTMRAQHLLLGRAPTIPEIAKILAADINPAMRLGVDTLHRIVAVLNNRVLDDAQKIRPTKHRPFFRFYADVEKAAKDWYDTNYQTASQEQMIGFLRERGVRITITPLLNILKHLRRTKPANSVALYRLSRKRLSYTWADVNIAYKEAKEFLGKQGVKRLPSPVEISRMLQLKGHKVSSSALKLRMPTCPPELKMPMDTYTDPIPYVIRSSYTRLTKSFGRPPTVSELTAECNKFTWKEISRDALWTRVKQMNATRGHQKRISLSEPKQSGIYDSDIRSIHSNFRASHGRAPTLTELRTELLSKVPNSWIQYDSLSRRIKRMKLPCTHENERKWVHQQEVVSTIKKLALLHRRPPLQQEVLEEVAKTYMPITPTDLTRTLATFKKRRSERVRRSIRLARPASAMGKLRDSFEAIYANTNSYPSIPDIANVLKWSEAGVASAIPHAQRRNAQRRERPIVTVESPLAANLTAVEKQTSWLLRRIKTSSAEKPSSVHRALLQDLPTYLNNWELPSLLLPSDSLSIDETLLRGQILWIHIVCMHAPTQAIPQECEYQARHEELLLSRLVPGATAGERNPFQGMAHALKAATFVRRLSSHDAQKAMDSALATQNRAAAWAILRQEIDKLASECGFPRISN